jgi:hypothetical protein
LDNLVRFSVDDLHPLIPVRKLDRKGLSFFQSVGNILMQALRISVGVSEPDSVVHIQMIQLL